MRNIGIQTERLLALSSIMLIVLLTGAIWSPRAATAATYYVATTGSPSNTCTQAQSPDTPKQTIANGKTCLASGDILTVRGGFYNEVITKDNLPSGSSWSTATLIRAFPGEVARVNNIDINTYSSGSVSYVIFRGFLIDGNGVFIGGPNGSFIRLDSIEIRNAPDSGLQLFGTGHHNELINLHVHDNGNNRLDHGLYAAQQHLLVDGGQFNNNSGYGIQIYDSTPGVNSTGTIIRNARIYNNRGDGGVTLNHGNDLQFYNNLVYNNTFGNGGEGLAICYGAPNNVQVYNNTFYGNGGAGLAICANVFNTLVKNNIVFGNNGTIRNFGTGTTFANNSTVDPSFVNAGGGDFQLRAMSVARDAGTTLTTFNTDIVGVPRPQGPAWDIGAYEFVEGGGGPPPITTTTWIFCATENQFCAFTGTKLVRYGAGSTFTFRTATNGISCSNAVFGDPLVGVVKHCDQTQP